MKTIFKTFVTRIANYKEEDPSAFYQQERTEPVDDDKLEELDEGINEYANKNNLAILNFQYQIVRYDLIGDSPRGKKHLSYLIVGVNFQQL